MQGLRYSVESHAIAYPRMHPATLQHGFHAPACHRMHPATPQRGFHAPACQRAPWQLRNTPVLDPKPSRNNPCPPATISSHLRPQNMHIHTNFTIHPQRGRSHTLTSNHTIICFSKFITYLYHIIILFMFMFMFHAYSIWQFQILVLYDAYLFTYHSSILVPL